MKGFTDRRATSRQVARFVFLKIYFAKHLTCVIHCITFVMS